MILGGLGLKRFQLLSYCYVVDSFFVVDVVVIRIQDRLVRLPGLRLR